jgi:hypothetical protein
VHSGGSTRSSTFAPSVVLRTCKACVPAVARRVPSRETPNVEAVPFAAASCRTGRHVLAECTRMLPSTYDTTISPLGRNWACVASGVGAIDPHFCHDHWPETLGSTGPWDAAESLAALSTLASFATLSPSRLPSLSADALTPASGAELAASMPASSGADRATSRTWPQPRTAIGSRHEELNTSHDDGGCFRPKTRSAPSRSFREITDPSISLWKSTCSDSTRPDRTRLRGE